MLDRLVKVPGMVHHLTRFSLFNRSLHVCGCCEGIAPLPIGAVTFGTVDHGEFIATGFPILSIGWLSVCTGASIAGLTGVSPVSSLDGHHSAPATMALS